MKNCLFKSTGCSLAAFSKRFIFKFGGKVNLFNPCNKIEYYDCKDDTWIEVKIKESEFTINKLPFCAGSI